MRLFLSKFLARFAVAAALVVSATAAARAAEDRLKIATTFTIIADMARNVAGDAADVVSITRPGAEIHEYRPTPQDLVSAQDADMILWNGLNLELWFEQFFSRLDGVPSVVVSEGVDPIAIGDGPYSGKPNPHAWMSPSDALIYVENIRAAFAEADPENADVYAANATAYSEEIKAVSEPVKAILADVPEEQRWLVTSEGAFSYFARDFGLRELYLWPINSDDQGTPRQVKQLIDTVRAEGIPVVFSESTVSDKPARQAARETGARYGGILYVDSLTEADGPVPTYLDLLRVTAATVANGLKAGS
ncbi:MAG: metal ABC transporter substrate-binding protein [Pseudomonadota bacterium]